MNKSNIKTTIIGILRMYPVKRAAFFGSYAKNLNTEDSDIDLVVEFNNAKSTFIPFFNLYDDLEEATGMKIDMLEYRDLLYDNRVDFVRNVESSLEYFYET